MRVDVGGASAPTLSMGKASGLKPLPQKGIAGKARSYNEPDYFAADSVTPSWSSTKA